jgi:cell division GTPase FtsZ
VVTVRVALIGIERAGGKVVEALVADALRTGGGFVADALAVNTARADLLGLSGTPREKQILIGTSRVKGHGVGGDNDLGAEITNEDVNEVLALVDTVPVHEVDAFLVVAGLGGGTGSGGAPVLARALGRLYDEPVYGLGILPAADEAEAVNRITSLVRRATLGRLTLPCEIDSAERGLVVVSGPPEQLSRKGIERARRWLEEATGTMEVRSGDDPVPDSNFVAAVVLRSGVYDVPRIKELQRVAIETRRNVDDRDARSDVALGDLLRSVDDDTGDELEPLF